MVYAFFISLSLSLSLSLSACLAAFLSSLGQYEIAIPVRVGPNGETLDADTPQYHTSRRRRSAEDRLPDSVLAFWLIFHSSIIQFVLYLYTTLNYSINYLTFWIKSIYKLNSLFFSFSKLFYQLSTSRNNFLLNLTLQGGLLSRQFRVEYWKRGRLAWSHPYSPHCHYIGHLQDQPHSSKVALSNCNGLVRLKPPSLIHS